MHLVGRVDEEHLERGLGLGLGLGLGSGLRVDEEHLERVGRVGRLSKPRLHANPRGRLRARPCAEEELDLRPL